MRFNIKWRAAAIPQLAALLSAVGAGLLAQIRAHQPVGLAQFEVSGGAARSSDLHNSQVHKLLRLHRLHLHQNCSHARARRHRQHEMRGRIVNSKIGGPRANRHACACSRSLTDHALCSSGYVLAITTARQQQQLVPSTKKRTFFTGINERTQYGCQ